MKPIYSPSLFVYNTQEKLFYINTSFFSIFDRVIRIIFYLTILLNVFFGFQYIILIYLLIYLIPLHIFFNIMALRKKFLFFIRIFTRDRR
jgi:hypothetical protein